MKRVLLISALLISLAGAGQHYIQGSIQKGSAVNSVNIMFLPNYTSGPTEVVNYLSLAIAIPTASATGVTPALAMTGPFTGMNMVPAIPFSYTQGSMTIYTWVYSSVPSSMPWTNGVAFVGATITFEGGLGSSNVRLVDFTNKGGGANTNSLFVVVTNNAPFDVVNYSNMFYPISGTNGSITGTDTELDQYVETNQPIFLSSVCPLPGLPQVGGITTTSANITWNAVPGVTGYEIELSTSPTPTGGSVTTGLSFSRNDLAVGTAYYFHIRSVCSPGNYSGWVRADFATICPTSTSITTDSITPSGVKIKWQPVVSAGQGYQYAITSTSGTPTPSTIFPTLLDSAVVTGLTEGTTYYAQVRVNCSPGVYSQWINQPFITTYPPCLPPDKITVANLGASADINWPNVPKAFGYEYAITTSDIPPNSGTPTTSLTAHITDLQSNTKYYVYVRSQCGPSRYSPWVYQSFNSSCFKPIPFLIGNFSSPGTAKLGWRKIKGALKYEYVILTNRSIPSGSLNFTPDTVLQVNNLVPGNKYYLHVRTHCAPSVVSEWNSLEFYSSGISIKTHLSDKMLTVSLIGTESMTDELAVFDATGRLIKKNKNGGKCN